MMNRRIHRNITLQRILLDIVQLARCQAPVVGVLGRPFQRSRRFVEIDITYRCNLHCRNCNRSCSQSPSQIEMAPETLATFIAESIAAGANWQRIRLLGGEPTLHGRFFEMVEMLRAYRNDHRPHLHIEVCTNGRGRKVNRRLQRLPRDIAIKNTYKTTARQRLFRPFNMAPIDSPFYRFSDFSSGCRILEDCGIGLTPNGYYACAVAGGIDRIFGFKLGRPHIPRRDDDMIDHLRKFCSLCGHFGFRWPTKRVQVSATWIKAYRKQKGPTEKVGPH